jgi:hypothetical protein
MKMLSPKINASRSETFYHSQDIVKDSGNQLGYEPRPEQK